jgi:hypothetical protein
MSPEWLEWFAESIISKDHGVHPDRNIHHIYLDFTSTFIPMMTCSCG